LINQYTGTAVHNRAIGLAAVRDVFTARNAVLMSIMLDKKRLTSTMDFRKNHELSSTHTD